MKKLSSAATFCGTRPLFEKSYEETIGFEDMNPDLETTDGATVLLGSTETVPVLEVTSPVEVVATGGI